jgi:hypothetical protein
VAEGKRAPALAARLAAMDGLTESRMSVPRLAVLPGPARPKVLLRLADDLRA